MESIHVDINFQASFHSLTPHYAIIADIIDFERLSALLVRPPLWSAEQHHHSRMLSSGALFPMGEARERESESSSLSAAKSGLEIELTPETGERARAEIKIVSELFEAAKGNTTGEEGGRDVAG